MLRKILKISLRVLAGLLALILLVWLLIQTEPVQNFIVSKIANKLSKDLHTTVKIGHVDLSLFDRMDLDNTLILDQSKDTLLKAGSLKLRITDWFFFKQNIELKYIGLEDAVIKQQRTDSLWNYQFIIDHFSSAQQSKKQSKKIVLQIQKIDLKNVVYVKNDQWNGQKLTIRTGSLLLDAENIDLSKNLILIKSIDMDKTYFNIENYTGNNPVTDRTNNDSVLHLNPSNMRLQIASIKITDGTFGSGLRGEIPLKDRFDGKHIEISKINGSVNNLRFINDTLKASVNLSAVERSGLQLKHLQTDFRLTPQIMEFAKLNFKTGRSTLGNYYAMHFKHFNYDMSNYVQKVVMNADFRNGVINTNDLAFFAPSLNTWNERFLINGKFNGTVSHFKVENIFLSNGSNTYASGDLEMQGLPEISKTTITLNNANVQTNSREVSFLYPKISNIKTPDLAALGNTHFVGNFSGTPSTLKAKGTLASALGGMYTDLSLSFPKNAEPVYSGSVETQQFNLGKFLAIPNLGNVSFKGEVEGKSFQLDKVATRVNGNFSALAYKDYTYTNLAFNGEIKQKNFKGDFTADDPNFNFTSTIVVDLNQSAPSFNVLGDLGLVNLKALGFTKDSVSITGLFDLNFQGHNIDDFLGYAKILNATVVHNSQRLDFDSLAVTAALDSAGKKLTIGSNEFLVSVEGQYSILELPQSFQSFLNHYYPSYINPPRTQLSNQNFTATISTGQFERYARLLDSNFSGFNNAFLSGRISTREGNRFNLDVKIASAKYKHYSLEDAFITGDGNNDSLLLTGNIGKIYLSDSMYFPNTKISISSSNDLSHVQVATSANTTLNDAQLEADVRTMPDGVAINFRPSSFVLNDKKWNLQNQGEVVVTKNFASAKNMKFTQGFQEISVESVEEEGGTANTLAVRLKDVNLGDIIPLFVQRPLMEGIANGTIYLRDIYTKLRVEAEIKASQFRLNNDSIGVVNINSKYNTAEGKVLFKIGSNNQNFVLNAEGTYNTKDSTHNPLETTMKLDHAKVGFLNSFLGNLFGDITGLATGSINLHGDFKDLHLVGAAHLDSGALTVKYTQVRYLIPSADFVFKEDGIDFGTFEIKDKFGNTGNVRGRLFENGFKENRFDFDLSTDKLLLIDTKAKDNDNFYGTAIGRGSLTLKGPQENMRMTITAEANDFSHVYIPTSTSKKSADADFIVFKQYGLQVQPETENTTHLNIDLTLTATNYVTISVILDELTGDVIEATGNGRLLIKVPAQGDITMNGRYNIDNGNYNFNFQSLVKKPFELLPEQNSYIEWTGDPFDANIKIRARYTAKNVAISDLISQSTLNLNPAVQGYRGDVYVIADLTGKLTKPDINFSLDFPQGSAIRNDDNFNRLLAKMQTDENEMLKQVTWLIVFDAFSPYGEISGNQAFIQSTAYNTISQKVAGVLNNAISDFLYKLTGDKTLQFDIGAKTYSSYNLGGISTGSTLNRGAVELKLNKSLFNNKVIVTFGGDLDFNVSGAAVAASNNNLQWLPDIAVQIVLTKDRKLRAIVFNHSSLGVYNTGTLGRVTRQGVSISYTTDFDKLFGKNEDIYFTAPKPADSTSRKQKGSQ
ncbi:MAG TPA: translocation/assembly module TamB domain-containing protein [Parafilimonas sp.]|nr:translocation/assembly module TamB domain-containing protein [Parafilimonas sp.]